MTYGNLKALTAALLIGDNKLPKEDEILLPLLEYAFHNVSEKAESLHLMTENRNKNLTRSSRKDMYIRKPRLPESDGDELDIDDELCFAVSEYIASFLSAEKINMHIAKAEQLIILYNNKIDSVLSDIRYNEDRGDGDV